MSNILYLVERRTENGDFEEPMLMSEDGLIELAREYDEDIREEVVIDALESTFGYELTEIRNMEDVMNMFETLKENYMSF